MVLSTRSQATERLDSEETAVRQHRHNSIIRSLSAWMAPAICFIADRHNNRIRMVNAAGIIITLTGGGSGGFRGEGGPASSAQIWDPRGVAVDIAGNVFIADSGNNRIRMINAAGIITTVVGNTPGFSGDGGAAA